MKKLLISIILIFLLAACGQQDIQIHISAPQKFVPGKKLPIELKLTDQEGTPVSVNQIQVKMEMEDMDHGKIIFKPKENDKGDYVGETKMPMSGEWLATITYNYKQHHYQVIKKIRILNP